MRSSPCATGSIARDIPAKSQKPSIKHQTNTKSQYPMPQTCVPSFLPWRFGALAFSAFGFVWILVLGPWDFVRRAADCPGMLNNA
jgi:hypothetical protein